MLEGEPKTRIYLDTNVYKRPFDDQGQPRIWLETLAFGVILQMVEGGEIDLVSSAVVEYENSRNPFPLRKAWVVRCLGLANHRQVLNRAIIERAQGLETQGIGPLDALHIACAEASNSRYFLTCDDGVVGRYVGELKVLNPVEYVVSVVGEQL